MPALIASGPDTAAVAELGGPIVLIRGHLEQG